MKLRAAVAGFRGQPWYVHLLVLLGGWLLFAAAYAGAVAVRGGLPLLWVTGAAGFRATGAYVATPLAGAYYGWLVTRARGGPATNLLALVVAPVALPGLVASVLGGRVPAAVLGESRSAALLAVFLGAAAALVVVWTWARRRFDTAGERAEWVATHLPASMDDVVGRAQVTAEREG